MKAFLLAAGLGTRLRPITNNIPKCLVPINGRPLLDFWIESLVNSGVKEILINTHYMHDKVLEYTNSCKYKKFIKISYEDKLLGTAGSLLRNRSFFGDKGGLFIHADNFCLSNLKRFYQGHFNRPNNCLVTMMTFISENPKSCGIVEVDEKNILIDFHEKVKQPPGNLANGAIYFLSKSFIKNIGNIGNLNDFSNDVIPKYFGKIYTYPADGLLLDIGSMEAYKKINQIYKRL